VDAASEKGVRRIVNRSSLEDIQAALSSFIEAFNDLDWDRFCACFAQDATVFHPDNPETASLERVEGKAAIERSFRPVFDAARQHTAGPLYQRIEPKHVRVQVFSSAAVVSFEFDRPQASMGRRTLVLEERSGTWKIVHLHASNVNRAK
jgi:ketosteroid isomerase-like protein